MKKEIMWNNNKWIVDYGTRTIYQEATVYENDPNRLTAEARVGNYPFREYKGSIYFKAEKEFYKITDDEVHMISKDEYQEQKKYRKLNVKNNNTVRYISEQVSSILIDEVFRVKHNIIIYTKVGNSNIVPIISKKFPIIIKGRIQEISKSIILKLPYVDTTNIKEEVKKVLSNIFKNGNEYYSEIIDIIYENDKTEFDQLASEFKYYIEEKNQRKNHTASVAYQEDLSLEHKEDTIEGKAKK